MQSPEKGWFPRLQAIEFVGVTLSKWDHQILHSLPPSAIRKEGPHKTMIHGPSVVRFLIEQTAAGDGEDGLLGGGGSSPELIKARTEFVKTQTKLRQYDLQVKRESVVSRDQVHEVFGAVAGYIRDGIDKLQRVYGKDAYDLMMEKIEDAERTIKQRFGDPKTDDSDGSPSSDTDDEAAEDQTLS